MMHTLSLLPVLACAVLMFSTVAIVWLAVRTPLRHTAWGARHTPASQTSPQPQHRDDSPRA